MKLSERIQKTGRVDELIDARREAARRVASLEREGKVHIGVDWDEYIFEQGHPLFEAFRVHLIGCVATLDEELRAHGVEVDMAQNDAGDPPDEQDDGEAEEEEAA